MPLYPARALERAMKIKEVITRAMSGQINWLQAAEIIGISDRSMRRWRERLSIGGYQALLDRRSRRPSVKRIDVAIVEKMLKLYREKYFDLNVKHFVEKLHSQGQEPFYRAPEPFAELMRSDYDKYGKLVKAANIKLEE